MISSVNTASSVTFKPALAFSSQSVPSIPMNDFRSLDNTIAALNQEMLQIVTPSTYDLVDLMPAKPCSKKFCQLPDLIYQYHGFVKIAQEALASFSIKNLALFNPIVGENGCQMRAAMFLELTQNKKLERELFVAKHQFKIIDSKLAVFEEDAQSFKSFENGRKRVDSFNKFIKDNQASVSLSENLFLITSAYLLTLVKESSYVIPVNSDFGIPEIRETSNYNILIKTKNFTQTFAKTLVPLLQIHLSKLSVTYVQRIAASLITKDQKAQSSLLVLKSYIIKDHHHRYVAPCFPMGQLLMLRLSETKRPIILRVNKYVQLNPNAYSTLTIAFKGNGKGGFQALEPSRDLVKEGAFFVYANNVLDGATTTNYTKRHFTDRNNGMLKALLENFAAHSQYAMDDSQRPYNPECDKARKKAIKNGNCKENPVFRVEHISSGSLKELMDTPLLGESLDILETATTQDLYHSIARDRDLNENKLRLIFNNKVLVPSRELLFKAGLSHGSLVYATCSYYTPQSGLFPNFSIRLQQTPT